MLFNTIPFGFFALIVFGLYYLPLLRRWQAPVLVLASFVFYGWSAPWLLSLLVFCIALNAMTSFLVAKSPPAKMWTPAALGVVLNLAMLCVFKYASLFRPVVPSAAGALWTLVHLPLPIGISFFTFEGISLLVDSLRARRENGERPAFVPTGFRDHLANTSLFIAFFPHLIAGPILKARQFVPQIARPKLLCEIDWDLAIESLILGFFLKTVLADNLKDYTQAMSFPAYRSLSGGTAAFLVFGYAMQIFADFSGYSLIAIGLGALFGYRLPQNFNWPYISTSLSDFWRRWHISLSSWLRDYLYISLGGNRRGEIRTYFNLILVMALGGLWHGAALSYMVWGLFHGLGLAAERRLFGKRLDHERNAGREPRAMAYLLRVLGVFLFVSAGWILFKLPDFAQAIEFVKILCHPAGGLDRSKVLPILVFGLPVVFFHILHMPAMRSARRAEVSPVARAIALRASFYGVLLFAVLTSGGSVGEFIYFQF